MKNRWIIAVLALFFSVGCGRDGAPVDRTYNLAWIHGDRMKDFTGRGSVIGMREAMFDLDHPAFAKLSLVYNNARRWKGGQSVEETHGTHMLGILAASGSIRGLAPTAGYALTSTANHNMAFEELEGAGVDVVNNSYIMATYSGYESISKTVKNQTLYARGGTGIVHVFAAGNQGKHLVAGVAFPAVFAAHALIVGELDEGDLTLCSNYGKEVDVFVQVPVLTTTVGGSFGVDRGSSCSVAVAVAVVAKVRQLRPDLNATTIMDLICKTADHIGGVAYDQKDEQGNMRSDLYGCGSLNADKLFEAAEVF